MDFHVNHSPPEASAHAAVEAPAEPDLPQDPGGSPLSETLPYNPVKPHHAAATVSSAPTTTNYYTVASGTTTGIFLTEAEMRPQITDPVAGKLLPNVVFRTFDNIDSATASFLTYNLFSAPESQAQAQKAR